MAMKLLNGLLFNVAWLSIVLLQDALLSWAAAAVYVCAHLWLMGEGRSEVLLIALVAGLGLAVDQLLFTAGVLENVDGQGVAPLWLSALWPAFATTLMHAFSGLRSSPPLAAVVGGVGGYLSYLAGTGLSGVAFAQPVFSDLLLVTFWGVMFPTLLVLAAQLGKLREGCDARTV